MVSADNSRHTIAASIRAKTCSMVKSASLSFPKLRMTSASSVSMEDEPEEGVADQQAHDSIELSSSGSEL